jgi:hypothetical protein
MIRRPQDLPGHQSRAPHALAIALSLTVSACVGRGDAARSGDSALARDLALASRVPAALPQLADTTRGSRVAASPPAPVAPAVTPPPSAVDAPQRATEAQSPPSAAATPTASDLSAASADAVRPGGTSSAPPGAGPGAPILSIGSAAAAAPASGTSSGTSALRLPAGLELTLASESKICTNTAAVGDQFVASVTVPAKMDAGATVPAGTSVLLEVTAAKAGTPRLGLAVKSVTVSGSPALVNGVVTYAQSQTSGSGTGHAAIRGAQVGMMIGNIIGQIAGHGRGGAGAVGTAAGAATGAAAGAVTAPRDACLPQGGRVTVRLTQAVEIGS